MAFQNYIGYSGPATLDQFFDQRAESLLICLVAVFPSFFVFIPAPIVVVAHEYPHYFNGFKPFRGVISVAPVLSLCVLTIVSLVTMSLSPVYSLYEPSVG